MSIAPTVDEPGISTRPSLGWSDPRAWGRLEVFPAACTAVVFAAALCNSLDITNPAEAADESGVGLNSQVAMKLLLAGAAAVLGGIGFLLLKPVQRVLLGFPGLILVLLGCVLVATSAFAYHEAANVCRAAALVNVAYICFVPTAVVLIGLRRFLIALLCGLVVYMIGGWFLYLFMPSIGVFEEELESATFVHRMGGVAHPNTVGRVAAIAAVLCLALLRSRDLAPRFPGARTLLVAIIGFSAATLIVCFSRTAMLGCMVSAAFLYADKIFSRNGLVLALLGGAVLVGGGIAAELFSSSDMVTKKVMSATTKTGDVEELTSATGRTDIWAEAIRLIAERPLTGWGLNSAPFLLVDHSLHTHNAVLHAAFSGGVIAGGLLLILLLWNVVYGIRDSEPIVRALSVFILISSMVEDTVLDTFPMAATILWIFVLLYPSLKLLGDSGYSRGAADDSALRPT